MDYVVRDRWPQNDRGFEDEAKHLAIGGLVPIAFNFECEARIDTAGDMDVGAKSVALGRVALDKDEECPVGLKQRRGRSSLFEDRVGTSFKLLVCYLC